MHERTKDLARRLRREKDTVAQLEVLRGAYSGERCAIVTCGPSLKAFNPEELESALNGTLVIGVKQAVDIVGAATDFLCFNPYNVSRYRPPARETIRVLCADPGRRLPQFNGHDLAFELDPHSSELSQSLAGTEEFDRHTLDCHLGRPWGPGIVYELAIYLAVHVGVAEVALVGWDIGNAGGNNVHFYDSEQSAAFFDRGRAAPPLAAVRSKQPEWVKRLARFSRAAFAHWRGAVYNRTTMLPGEADLVARSSGSMAEWLRSMGVEPYVVSDHSLASDTFPRLERSAFFRWAATSTDAAQPG